MFETSVSLVKLDFETKISPALTGEINHMTTKLTKEIRKISLADRTRSDAENLTRSKPCPSRGHTLLIREDNRRCAARHRLGRIDRL
jgi:hypothetical protein